MAIAIGQTKVRPFAEFALIQAKGEMVEKIWFDTVIGIEAPVANVAELLEGLGQRTRDGPHQGIAIEILPAKHAIHVQLVRDVVVAFDRVNTLPGTWGTRSVVTG